MSWTPSLLPAFACFAITGALLSGGLGDPPASQEAPDALRLRVAQALVDQTRPPIGSIIAYWGARANIDGMENWELCDGTPVRTMGSPLFGVEKPDLSGRFVRGVTGDRDLRARPVTGGTGRTDAIAIGTTGSTALQVKHLPAHSHPHRHHVARSASRVSADLTGGTTVGTEGGKGADSKYVLVGVGGDANVGRTNWATSDVGNGEGHTHSLPSVPEHSNTPPYVGLFYIMRVK